jgi:CHAT domain-containing protein
LYNMGFIANEQGQHQEALAYLQRALRLKRELEDRDGTLTVEEELAATYMSLGQYDLAQENLDRSLTNAGEQTAYHRSVSLYYLGKLYLLKGDYGKAISHLHQAAQIGIEQQRLDLIDPPLVNECRAYFLQKEYEKARQALAQQIKQTESRRELIVGGELEKALFFETSIEPYQLMVDVLLAQNKQFDALTYADQARGRVLLDVLRGGRADILRSLTPTEMQTEARLNAELVSLNIKLSKENALSNPSPARLTNLDNQLEQARLTYEALTMSLYAKYQKSNSTRSIAKPLTADDLRDLVPDSQSAVLEYDVTEDRTLLFVLTKDDTGRVVLQTYRINLGKHAIEQMVARFRLLVTSRDQEYAEPAQQLYQTLIGPAEHQLANKTSIGIVPNSALWALPFQALQSPKNGRFMIEDHALYFAPSLTVMRELINKRKASGRSKGTPADRLLAVGDPFRRLEEVSLDREDKLGNLPHAQEEIGLIINSYGARRSTRLTGRVAGERAIKVAAPSQRVLHFAAHTVLDNYRPMYSRILLAAPTVDDTEDGQLEAREIMNMHLVAELVVLSSCQTALGRVGEGEGVIGMAWAFAVAGVPTTVATQWGVESESTANLMTEFYQGLLPRSKSDHRQTKAEALQAAQLVLLNTKKYHHPFYWAPFVMIGDGPSPNF